MMKNRAVWVALAVLAIATLLMVFVVLPRINGGKTMDDLATKVEDATKTATDAAKKAGEDATKLVDATKDAAKDAAKTATDQAAATIDATKDGMKTMVLDKMGRLKADTDSAADELKALYATGTVPTPEALAPVKAKLEAALKAVSDFKVPEGIDATLGGVIGKVSGEATKALATLSQLPADAAGATAAIDGLKANMNAAIDAVTTAFGVASNATPAATDTAVAAVLPSFDVLRVEKDGSTVIAGRAATDSKLEIVDGDKTIATTDTGATGEFAAVLDNPLAPGDHQIVLKTTGKDGKVSTSEEVATVSVPKDASGELLAMVSKPGVASRIITAPETAAKPATEVAAKAADTATADATKATTDAAKATADATQATADATKAAADATKAATDAVPALPDASKELANTAPAVGTTTDAAKVAAPAVDQTKVAPAGQAEVVVSAVEIEGDKLFVAGGTKANAMVRVYADDKFVGETKADENGRFVVDNTIPLSIGKHTIRADVLTADGAKVEFRASVPFDRPEGEQMAVVADPSANATDNSAMVSVDHAKLTKAQEDAAKALALLNGLFDNGRVPTAEELAAARSASEIALKALADMNVAGGDTATNDIAGSAAKALDALKALPADAAGLKAGLAQLSPMVSGLMPEVAANTTDAKPAQTSGADDTAKPADQGQAEDKAKTTDANGATSTNDAAQSDTSTTTKSDAGSTGDTAKAAPDQPSTDGKVADGSSTDVAKPDASKADATKTDGANADGSATNADGVKVIEQAPLKASATSVIIRRGDTLWQISRRVYGKGVRYTTIYLANQDQIANPDEIRPGQVFGVPDKPLDNSEELHRERVLHHHK